MEAPSQRPLLLASTQARVPLNTAMLETPSPSKSPVIGCCNKHPERIRVEAELRLLCRRGSLAAGPVHYHFVAGMPYTPTCMIFARRVYAWARSRHLHGDCMGDTSPP